MRQVLQYSINLKGMSNSKIYPTLQIVNNKDKKFVPYSSIPTGYKAIIHHDSRISTYYSAIKKLFKQITNLQEHEIWVCEKDITMYPIHIYFTEPDQYLITKCCSHSIYIEFEYDFSGCIRCSKCNKICYDFVHAVNTFENRDKDNYTLFKENKQNVINKKTYVRQLISSEKYRQKKLKNVLDWRDSVRKEESEKIGEFIIEIIPDECEVEVEVKVEVKEGSPEEIHGSEIKQVKLSSEIMQIKKIIQSIFQ